MDKLEENNIENNEDVNQEDNNEERKMFDNEDLEFMVNIMAALPKEEKVDPEVKLKELEKILQCRWHTKCKSGTLCTNVASDVNGELMLCEMHDELYSKWLSKNLLSFMESWDNNGGEFGEGSDRLYPD